MQLQGLPDGNRTRDLWITRPVLYHDSHPEGLGVAFFATGPGFGSYNVYHIDTRISNTVDIGGYNFVHNYRHKKKTGGGVGLYLYLKSEYEYKIRVDLTFDDMVCVESVFVEISRPKGKKHYCWGYL